MVNPAGVKILTVNRKKSDRSQPSTHVLNNKSNHLCRAGFYFQLMHQTAYAVDCCNLLPRMPKKNSSATIKNMFFLQIRFSTRCLSYTVNRNTNIRIYLDTCNHSMTPQREGTNMLSKNEFKHYQCILIKYRHQFGCIFFYTLGKSE